MSAAAPVKFLPNLRFEAGRPVSDLNGCRAHRNVSDMIRWPSGNEECALCARDKQEARMTPGQRKNPAFHLEPYWEWIE